MPVPPKPPRPPTPPATPARDYARPKTNPHGDATVFGTEEPTQVGTDVQVFRAVKALHTRINQSEAEAKRSHGELQQEVVGLTSAVGRLDGKQDEQSKILHSLAGKMEIVVSDRQLAQRSRSPSSITRAAADAAKVTIAEQVLLEQRAERSYSRKVKLLIVGGIISLLTSGAVIGAIIHSLTAGAK